MEMGLTAVISLEDMVVRLYEHSAGGEHTYPLNPDSFLYSACTFLDLAASPTQANKSMVIFRLFCSSVPSIEDIFRVYKIAGILNI